MQTKSYQKNGRGKGKVVERVDYMEQQLVETLRVVVNEA